MEGVCVYVFCVLYLVLAGSLFCMCVVRENGRSVWMGSTPCRHYGLLQALITRGEFLRRVSHHSLVTRFFCVYYLLPGTYLLRLFCQAWSRCTLLSCILLIFATCYECTDRPAATAAAVAVAAEVHVLWYVALGWLVSRSRLIWKSPVVKVVCTSLPFTLNVMFWFVVSL